MFPTAERPRPTVAVPKGFAKEPELGFTSRVAFPVENYARVILKTDGDERYPQMKFYRQAHDPDLKEVPTYEHRTVPLERIEPHIEGEWQYDSTKHGIPISLTHFSEVIPVRDPTQRSEYIRLILREFHHPIPIFSNNSDVLEDLRVLFYLTMHHSPPSHDDVKVTCVSLSLKKRASEMGTLYRHSLKRRSAANALVVHTSTQATDIFFAYLKLQPRQKAEFRSLLFAGNEADATKLLRNDPKPKT